MKKKIISLLGLILFIGGLACTTDTFANENTATSNVIIEEPLHNPNRPIKFPKIKAILPNNIRNQITDASQIPYQSVCFIYVNNSIQGSGVVIGKNAILTNRHVAAAAKNKNPENIKIAVGRTNNSTWRGSFCGTEIRYIPDGQDLAIVFTKPNSDNLNVGDISTPATFIENPNTTNGTHVRVIGYPGDKPWGTMWESEGKSIWGQQTKRIYYDASTFLGNSGSPVFNDQNQLIGIHFGAVSGANVAVRFNSYTYNFIKNNLNPFTQTINIGGQGINGYSDHSHDSGFSRVSLEVKDHKASLVKHSDYQFHWDGWKTDKYASIKLTDPNGNVLYDQAWKGNDTVKGNGYQKFGTFAQYDLPEGSTVEIYHAEGPWHRFSTNDDTELKSKLGKSGYTYTYQMQNNQLILTNVQ
ncbi:trypsin-like peptidase domain-containing protein [Enterococcus hirae]|nr:trypsin-like peptidase domain-containing protein [Enterococcus hirae]